MSTRQLKLYTTGTAGGSQQITTTINNINPTVSGAIMLDYAKRLNTFTTNTYTKTDLIETTNLDTETVEGGNSNG